MSIYSTTTSHRQWAALLLGCMLVLLLPFAVKADDYISPELIKVSTPLYKPSLSDFEPTLGTYTYTVSWEGISAASAEVLVDEVGDHYQVTALASTYSGIDLFYKLRYRAESSFSSLDFSPDRFRIDNQENSKRKLVDMRFAQDGQVSVTRTQGDDTANAKHVDFTPNNLVLDPISAAFLARGLAWSPGETKTFDVFNGKSRYLISLTASQKQNIEFQGREREVFIIVPKVRNLTSAKANSKLRDAEIYVSADRNRDILRIVSSVFVGSVNTELESFVPKPQSDDSIRLAQLRRGNAQIEDVQAVNAAAAN